MQFLKSFILALGMLFFMLVVGGAVLVDFALDHAFSYRFGAPIRAMLYPEFYDDTYLESAQWPLPDSQPFKATVKFDYKGKPYSVDRIVRCYRDVGKMAVHGTGFIWHAHLKLFVVPLHDGGVLITSIPSEFCDENTGISESEQINRRAQGVTYINSGNKPTYLETHFSREDSSHNTSVIGPKHPIDPKQVYISANHLEETNFEYSSNEQAVFYKGMISPRGADLYKKQSENTVFLTGVRATILFKSQWSTNASLVDFLADKSTPTLIPKKILLPSHIRDQPSKELEKQAISYFEEKGYLSANLNPGKYFSVFFELSDQHEWHLSHSQIGGFRYFRRGCDAEFRICKAQENIRDFLKEDFVRIGGLKEYISNIFGIYLPKDQVILYRPVHKTISIEMN